MEDLRRSDQSSRRILSKLIVKVCISKIYVRKKITGFHFWIIFSTLLTIFRDRALGHVTNYTTRQDLRILVMVLPLPYLKVNIEYRQYKFGVSLFPLVNNVRLLVISVCCISMCDS